MRILLLVFFLYDWYRYPFKINGSGTSPGYSDTPLPLQAGKYIAVGLLTAVLVLCAVRRAALLVDRSGSRSWMYAAVAMGYVALLPAALGIAYREPMSAYMVIIWSFGLLMLFFGPDPEAVPRVLGRVCKFFGVLSVLFFFVEVTLFLAFKRLPALSYEDSLLVRFGGLWDDPNGFAFAWPLIFPILSSLRWKRLWTAAGVVALLATGSLTGIASVVIGYVAAVMLLLFFRATAPTAWLRMGMVAVPAALLLGAAASIEVDWSSLIDMASAFAASKSGSVEGHLYSLDIFRSLDAYTLLGLTPLDVFGESAYVNWLANYGLVYVATIVSVLAATTLRLAAVAARRRAQGREPVEFAMLWYMCAVSIGLINLPLDRTYPINFLTTLLCGITLRSSVWALFRSRGGTLAAAGVGVAAAAPAAAEGAAG